MKKDLEKWIKDQALEKATKKFENKNLEHCGVDKYDRVKAMHEGVHHITSNITDDKDVRNKIKTFEKKSFEKLENDYDQFMDKHKNDETFLKALNGYGEQKLFSTTNTSNMKRYFNRFYDHEKSKELVEDIKIIRKDFNNYKNPTINELCDTFDMHASAYTRHFKEF